MYVQGGQVRDGNYSSRLPQLGLWGLALLAGVLAHSCLHTVLVVREHALHRERALQTVAKRASFLPGERREGLWGPQARVLRTRPPSSCSGQLAAAPCEPGTRGVGSGAVSIPYEAGRAA